VLVGTVVHPISGNAKTHIATFFITDNLFFLFLTAIINKGYHSRKKNSLYFLMIWENIP
jgi:hypothetical protein